MSLLHKRIKHIGRKWVTFRYFVRLIYSLTNDYRDAFSHFLTLSAKNVLFSCNVGRPERLGSGHTWFFFFFCSTSSLLKIKRWVSKITKKGRATLFCFNSMLFLNAEMKLWQSHCNKLLNEPIRENFITFYIASLLFFILQKCNYNNLAKKIIFLSRKMSPKLINSTNNLK